MRGQKYRLHDGTTWDTAEADSALIVALANCGDEIAAVLEAEGEGGGWCRWWPNKHDRHHPECAIGALDRALLKHLPTEER